MEDLGPPKGEFYTGYKVNENFICSLRRPGRPCSHPPTTALWFSHEVCEARVRPCEVEARALKRSEDRMGDVDGAFRGSQMPHRISPAR